jgi:hypothetical protein
MESFLLHHQPSLISMTHTNIFSLHETNYTFPQVTHVSTLPSPTETTIMLYPV